MFPYVPPHETTEPACDEIETLYGWSVRRADLGGDHERFDLATRRVLIDYPDDEEWIRAHVKAHFELGHVSFESEPRFTAAQEFHADAQAALWIDMNATERYDAEWELPAMDGEPTLGRTL